MALQHKWAAFRRCGLRALLGLAASCLAQPAAAQGEVELWTFSANLRESFTDNVLFTSVAAQEELISAATLTLGYNRVRRTSSFGAFGWVNGQLFGRYDQLNQAQFGLGLSGRKSLHRRFSWSYSAYYGDGINFDALLNGGRAVPQVDLKNGSVSSSTSFSLTPRTSWNLSVDPTYVRYRTTIPIDTASLPFEPQVPPDVIGATRPQPIDLGGLELPDGTEILRLLSGESILATRLDYWSWRVGTGFSHSFSPITRATVGFGYRSSTQSPRTIRGGNQYDGSIGFSRALDTTANLNGGYAYQSSSYALTSRTHSLTLGGTRSSAIASGGTCRSGRPTSTGPRGKAAAGPGSEAWEARSSSTGATSRVATREPCTRARSCPASRSPTCSLSGAGTLSTKRVFGSAFGYYRNARDQSDRRFTYESAFVSTALSVRFAKRFNGGLSYAFQYFDSGALPSATRSYFTLSFGYTRAWK